MEHHFKLLDQLKYQLDDQLPDMLERAITENFITFYEIETLVKFITNDDQQDDKTVILNYMRSQRDVTKIIYKVSDFFAWTFFKPLREVFKDTVWSILTENINKQNHKFFIQEQSKLRELQCFEKDNQDTITQYLTQIEEKQNLNLSLNQNKEPKHFEIQQIENNFNVLDQQKLIDQNHKNEQGNSIKIQIPDVDLVDFNQNKQPINQECIYPKSILSSPSHEEEEKINQFFEISQFEEENNKQDNQRVINDQIREKMDESILQPICEPVIFNPNIFTEESNNCLCDKIILNLIPEKSFQCVYCRGWTHRKCLPIYRGQKPVVKFICPTCTLLHIDPLNKVVAVLVPPQFYKPKSYDRTMEISFIPGPKQPGRQIEIRCIRLEESGDPGAWTRQSWPDIGVGYLNGQKILDFVPLKSSYGQKRRKDEVFVARHVIPNQKNIFSIAEGVPSALQAMSCRVRLSQTYFITVVEVQNMTPGELVSQVSLNKLQKTQVLQNKDFILNQVSMPIECCFTKQLINLPARGEFCTHQQPFDLLNYFILMKDLKIRDWKCPICKAVSFNFYIDFYQEKLLRIIKNKNIPLKKVEVNSQGLVIDDRLKFYMENENDNEVRFERSNAIKKLCQEYSKGTFSQPYIIE